MLHRVAVPALVLLAAFMWACTTQSAAPAEEEINMKLVQRIFDEAINQGNFDVFDELVSEDVIENEILPAGLEGNREGVKQWFMMFRSAFPDLRYEVEEMFASGNKVVVRLVMHGTHKGEFMGMAPTEKRIAVKAIDILRIADGKIVEHWGLSDSMTMMQQLGAIPAEAASTPQS